MIIPVFSEFFRRRGRRRVRQIMRGHRALKRRGQLGAPAQIRDLLANTRLRCGDQRASRLMFGAGIAHGEQIVRQYLLIRVAQLTLNRAVLLAASDPKGDVVHPLPAEWRQALTERGVRVAGYRSALMWQGYVILLWGYGVLTIARTVWQGIERTYRRAAPALGRYAFFENLTSKNLPLSGSDGCSHDIATWYARWSGRIPDLDSLCHRVKGVAPTHVNGTPVLQVGSAVPPPSGPAMLLRYAGLGGSRRACLPHWTSCEAAGGTPSC